jgi:hypothetical protein
VTLTRRPQPTPEELRAWIALCERLATQANAVPARPRLMRDDEPGYQGSYAECWDSLAAFLRDLL